MNWQTFAETCPEIAALGEERLKKAELCMVGTLRRDGSPRISPCELDFVDDDLMLGMMWQSRKARDLLRDPRCVVHNCIADRWATAEEFKLFGRAVDVQDPARRRRYRETIRARIDWAPEEPNYHLFAIDVDAAGFVTFDEEHYALAWDPRQGLRRMPVE